ncbi:MAG: porin family protein [Bacteroidota bacterium]
MRNTLILFLAISFLGPALKAQDNSGNLALGLRAGLNFHSITGSDVQGDVGLVIGGWGNYRVAKLIGLQGEFLYIQQGASRRADVLGIDFTTEFNLDYVAIPLMISIHPLEFLNLHGGIQPSIRVGKSTTVSCALCNSSTEDDVEDIGGFFDAMFIFGATINLPFGNGSWSISGDVRRGLINIAEESSGFTAKNTGFAFTVGYYIGDLSELIN